MDREVKMRTRITTALAEYIGQYGLTNFGGIIAGAIARAIVQGEKPAPPHEAKKPTRKRTPRRRSTNP